MNGEKQGISGIRSALRRRLQQTLEGCDAFSHDAHLRNLFVDTRVNLWRTGLPEAYSLDSRVQNTISFLVNKYNAQGKNALVLFLYVLRDGINEEDLQYRELSELADELETQLKPAVTALPPRSAFPHPQPAAPG